MPSIYQDAHEKGEENTFQNNSKVWSEHPERERLRATKLKKKTVDWIIYREKKAVSLSLAKSVRPLH